MKKRLFIPAAIVALMGVGGYLGHAASAPADGLSDLTLANAEALAYSEIINPNESYGYKLIECNRDGRITGFRCEIWSPVDVCNRAKIWGDCN